MHHGDDGEVDLELGATQRWMLDRITHPGGVRGASASLADRRADTTAGEVEQVVRPSRALAAADRLEIYHRAYFARLIECLESEFPAFRATVGDDAFNSFAFEYLQQHPSQSYTLNRLGAAFADFLAATRPQNDDAAGLDWSDFLVDLAMFEWTVAEVFDGPGIEGHPRPDLDGLKNLGEPERERVILTPAPPLRLLALKFPVGPYFHSVRRGEEPSLPPRSPAHVALTRRDYVVRWIDLAPAEHRILQAIVGGKPLGAAIEAGIAGNESRTSEVNLSSTFERWVEERFFTEWRLG